MDTFSVSSYKNKRNSMQGCFVERETLKAKLISYPKEGIKFWIPTGIFKNSLWSNNGAIEVVLPRWFELTLLNENLKPL